MGARSLRRVQYAVRETGSTLLLGHPGQQAAGRVGLTFSCVRCPVLRVVDALIPTDSFLRRLVGMQNGK